VINRIVEDPGLFDALYKSLPAYPPIDEITEKHIELYKKVKVH